MAPTTVAPTTTAPVGFNLQLCSFTQKALSEFYNQVYADVVRNNANEQLTYVPATQSVRFQSNGQCLKLMNNVSLVTERCDASDATQRWVLDGSRLRQGNTCAVVNLTKAGDVVRAEPCSDNIAQYIDRCTGATPKYVRLEACATRKVLSEAYTGLYADKLRGNVNELFELVDGTVRSVSNGQCLDAFRDGKSFGLHTYACDASNPNQKWYIDGNRIKHATHANLCLDADPRDAGNRAQVWQCFPHNDNQCWNILSL
ncbi:hypothetical protein ACHHYP_17419 [Achlya hypogyna]|uniref:Ricin B lectin domain-containing protein n=1 Tax=Achlya hypogyna TaxID=1202772 RepID=A0A1V9Y4H4_ACHHY|nr:hypothetical protein ACHHYP_17419 [Achlya hypogyna]